MRKLLSLTVAVLVAGMLGACEQQPTTPENSASTARGGMPGPPGSTFKVTAVHEGDQFRFELSDHEIPSGWTTIEFDNQVEATHFAFLRKATPEFLEGMKNDFGEVSTEAYIEAASIPFQEEFNPYFQGEITFGTFIGNLGPRVPAWFQQHRPIGGPGLTSGGVTSRTTQFLEPGTYFIECYVLNEEGVFHVTGGMLEKLVVTEESSDAPEPRPTMRISLSTEDGIEIEETQGRSGVRPGQHTVAVTFEDNETPAGHDLHLIRLDEGTTVEEVNAWMDWPDIGPDGFYNTDEFGPALTSYHGNLGPQTFLGGVQDIQPPLPETAYYHVRLKPGDYAWVAEIANPKARGFLEAFTVPFGTGTGN